MAIPFIEGSLRRLRRVVVGIGRYRKTTCRGLCWDGDSGLAQKKRKAALRTSAINQSISHGRGIGYYALAGGGPEALAR
jgi:hypothetical protein